MSVQTQINRIKSNLTAAFSAIREMGGTAAASANSDDLATAIRTIPTGGGGSVNIETMTVAPSAAGTTFAITRLKGEPKAFVLQYTGNLTAGSTRYVVSASSNGSTRRVQYAYKSGNNAYIYQSTSYLTATYSGGTLTLKTSSTTNGGSFYKGNYALVYVY